MPDVLEVILINQRDFGDVVYAEVFDVHFILETDEHGDNLVEKIDVCFTGLTEVPNLTIPLPNLELWIEEIPRRMATELFPEV
jgi:hypothetical protein